MLETIITSSLLIAILILLRYFFKGKINLRLQYALWLLVAIRLFMPFPIFESSLSVLNIIDIGRQAVQTENPVAWIQSESTQHIGVNITVGMTDLTDNAGTSRNTVQDELAAPDISPNENISLSDILYTVWLIGAIAIGFWFIMQNIWFYARLRKTREPAKIQSSQLPVYLSRHVKSPCLFGLRPAIYIHPDSLTDDEVLKYILVHEETHYRHGDHLWSYLRCVCLALHWFNPLVWWAAVLSRRDCEIACDESTLIRIGDEHRKAYGNTLINMIERRAKPSDLLLGATTMTSGKSGIKERITMIAKKPKMAIYTFVAVLLIVAVAVGCTFTGAGNKPTSFTEWSGSITEDEIEIAEVSRNYGAEAVRVVLTNDMQDKLVGILHSISEDDCAVNYSSDADYNYDRLNIRRDGKNWVFQNYSDKSVRVLFHDAETGAIYGSEGKLLKIDSPELYEFISDVLSDSIASNETGENDAYFNVSDADPAETVRDFLETMKEQDYTISLDIYEIAVSDSDTARIISRFKGSDYAKSKNWTDEYIENNIVAVAAYYSVRYDHNKIFYSDGEIVRRFYLKYDDENGLWSIWDNDGGIELSAFANESNEWPDCLTKPEGIGLLAEARQKAPFSIFIPTVLPAELVAENLTIDEGPPYFVRTDYRTNDGSVGLTVLNGPAGSGLAADPRKKGETINIRGGISGHCLTNQPEFGGPILWWEEDGSYVALSGPWLSKDDLVKIADSMSSTTGKSSWVPLTQLPVDYSMKQAISDGVYVSAPGPNGQETYNQYTVDMFYKNAFAGQAAFMRTMEMTDEGDPVITDFQYDGEKFTVTIDSSRDKFGDYGNKNFTVETYNYLVPHDRAQGTRVTIYYLSNEQNIYAETSDGGTTLIEGLGRIPTRGDE